MADRKTLAVVIVLAFAGTLPAQPKPGYSPSSTHLFPAGGRRGTTVEVRVGTECAPPETDFLVFGRGLSAPQKLGRQLPRGLGEPDPRRKPTETPITYPREWASRITIASDAPLGAASWRISCAQGGTGSRPFLVGDLPEYIETESNSRPERAESLTLPVTLNGQIYGEQDSDYFRFTLEKGQVLVCDVLAGRIGSRLDPLIQLLDPDGRLIDCQEFRIGSDPVLAHKAARDGEYLLRVANITVLGNAACVYRITLSTRPHAVYAFPAGGLAGSRGRVELFVMSGRGKLVASPRDLDFPATPGLFRPPLASRPLLVVDGRANLVEREPNDTAGRPQPVPATATVHGRLADGQDIDRYSFVAGKGQRFTFRCVAFPPGLPTLPVLALSDGTGKRLARAAAVKDPDREARIEWVAPADGTFELAVQDLRFGSRGGDDFLYRLTLQPARPDFVLFATVDSLNLVQAKDSKLSLRVKRLGGFDGAIDLAISGLPAGVTFAPKQIGQGQASVTLTLKATAEAASSAYTLAVTGTAKINGVAITRRLAARHLGIDSEGVAAGPATSGRLHLTICHKPVFRLFCFEAYLYAHRGTVFSYPMYIERLDGFDKPITVEIGDRQNRDLDGIEMISFVIPPGKNVGILPIYLPETMHINIQSQSQLYSQAHAQFTDKHGRRQSVLVLSEKRNMLRTRPLVVKMMPVDATVSGPPGAVVACRLRLERTTNFPGPMTVRLHAVRGGSGFSAEPVTLVAGASSVTVMLRLPDGQQARRPATLTFRGTGKMPNGTVTITESRVRFLPGGAAGN